MKEILLGIVDKIFEKVPFSREEEKLKKEVADALILKYETEGKEEDEVARAIEVIGECRDVKSVCEALGKDRNVQQILDLEGVKDRGEAERLLRKIGRYIYVQCLCIALMFQNILTILCQFSFHIWLVNGTLAVLFAGLFIFTAKKKEKFMFRCAYENLRFEPSVRQVFCDANDVYSKKFLNISMLSMGVFAYVFFSVLFSVLSLQYTLKDVGQQIMFMANILSALVYLFLKNYYFRELTDIFFVPQRRKKSYREWGRIALVSGGYFAVVTTALLVFRNKIVYINNWFFLLEIVYLLCCGCYNFTRRKRLVFRNITVNRKKIVWVSLLVLMVLAYHVMSMNLYLTQPYINTVARVEKQEDDIAYNEDDGVYTITTGKEEFKILQLTDIHLGGSMMSVTKDLKALKACNTLINRTKPDLVIVTGDLVFPMGIMSFSLNNNAPIMQFANFMRNTGIPWAFTYGNHDTEAMATLNPMEFDLLMKALSFKSSGNLLYPYIQPDIYGRNNQVIELCNKDGSIRQALFLLDSNDYVEGTETVNEYDYIHDDQVEWYKKNVVSLSRREGATVPSMVFFHIPLREYKEANDLYEAGDSRVKYFYGKLGEKMIDKICCSKYESKLFDTAVELGSTKAMFCGHDHYNNQSLEYKGIRLTYGYSIDYLVMPGIEKDTEQRGATLITVGQEGNIEIFPVRLNER